MGKQIELIVTFCREYYQKHFGKLFNYDREYFFNIDKRIEIDMVRDRELYKHFGDLGLGSPNPEPLATIGFDDTVNITAMFGGRVSFTSNYTWLEPNTLSTDEEVENLKTPQINGTWPHTLFMEQFYRSVEKCGADKIIIPGLHGMLESALDLRGERFLIDLIEKPSLAEKLLDVLVETIIQLKTFWDKKRYGKVQRGIVIGGCSSTLLAPRTFQEYILPRYNLLTRKFGGGAIVLLWPQYLPITQFRRTGKL